MGWLRSKNVWLIVCCVLIGFSIGQLASLYWARDEIPFLISVLMGGLGGGFGGWLVNDREDLVDRAFVIARNVLVGIVILFCLWMLLLLYAGWSMRGPV